MFERVIVSYLYFNINLSVSLIIIAGGSVVEFSECNLSKDDMCREGVIVMQSLPSPGNGSQVPESYLGVVSEYFFFKLVINVCRRCLD